MATVNPWKRFIGLLPGGSRTVGLVLSVDTAAGISRIQMRNGIEVVARGTSVPEGQNAFITDGEVSGSAPSLPQFDIEV
ncbi:hypothetical protein [Pseudomonas panipatensis]|uniref:Uncharacterized protein n=1 Tax=Pseudomonas panipatensis TaxID=428992 RepID=A0A1G8CXM2_9PSED|nr:hypothetical protein [Pseudomonas panipatensis]SDH49710.1 hypothetical protein SAMN05216272_101801 [Pseudomonas panipatensis]SMP63303.1 hypothetical protein SAMN06295951_10641 [Pseudomonas panipatensis]